jgi:hypothetical protein
MAGTRSTRHLASGLLGAIVAVALVWLAGSAGSMPDSGPLGLFSPAAVATHPAGGHHDGWGVLHHRPGAQRPAVVHGGPLLGALAATAGVAVLLVLLAGGLTATRNPRRLLTVWQPTTRGPPAVAA